MSVLTLLDAHLRFGMESLLDGADLAVEAGERICLVGRNGVGKSSLLRVLAGTLPLDGGRRVSSGGLTCAVLPQDPPAYRGRRIYEVAAVGVPRVGAALAAWFAADDERERTAAAARLNELDAWDADLQVRRVLKRFGLDPAASAAELSGGWRRKVALATALLSRPAVLLLDEPTNHLDLTTIAWFEQWLRAHAGTTVFVTHDRWLADACATRIVELDRGRLYSYPGSFAAYQERRAERLRREDLAFRAEDRRLAADEAWLRRGVKARLARNEGRVRDLKQRRELRRTRRDLQGRPLLRANVAARPGDLIFELRDVSWSCGGRQVIKPFAATVIRGDRIGIVGPNGAGKTTLVKLMLGLVKPTGGYVRTGMNVIPAYFDQYREQLNPQLTVADNVAEGRREVEINGKHRHVMTYLQDFLFSGGRARTPAGALSGGEKNRLLLARLFARPANVLVMDEPTNDLDLETLELLEDLLAAYAGTVVVISHDRAFIDHVVTEIWSMDGSGAVAPYLGGWTEWLQARGRLATAAAGASGASRNPPAAVASAVSPDASGRAARKGGRSFTEDHELAELPVRIEAAEAELQKLDAAWSDGALYRAGADGAAVRDLRERRRRLTEQLAALYQRWEMLEDKHGRD